MRGALSCYLAVAVILAAICFAASLIDDLPWGITALCAAMIVDALVRLSHEFDPPTVR